MQHASTPTGTDDRSEVRHTWSESDRFVPRAFVQPLQRFMNTETSGAIFMLVAALAALAWANSPWWHAQATLWETDLRVDLGSLASVDLTLVEWINDALMAVFFFVVGLEIKREMIHGELRDPRKAALPAIAALGGMIVPAIIYTLFNAGTDSSHGWGIPMATDIAFAVAVVALVGPRVPTAAKLFLLTLAIADDIGAIVVIAVFYTDDLSLGWLVTAFATLGVVVVCTRLHIRAPAVYAAIAIFLWYAVHQSGVHATLAGVSLGLLTPAWSFLNPRHFAEDARSLVDKADDVYADGVVTTDEYALNQAELQDLSRLVSETQSPLERLEFKLQPWVAFLIVPLFAFANAGVRLSSDAIDGIATDTVVLGVGIGLLVGKTIGVFSFTWLADRIGIGTLPSGITYRHVFGLAVTAGVGFTVALFVAGLAFHGEADLTDSAKIGILAGSLVSGIIGYLMLRSAPAAAQHAPEATPGQEPALID